MCYKHFTQLTQANSNRNNLFYDLIKSLILSAANDDLSVYAELKPLMKYFPLLPVLAAQ